MGRSLLKKGSIIEVVVLTKESKEKSKVKIKTGEKTYSQETVSKQKAKKVRPKEYEALRKKLKEKEAEAAEHLDHLRHLQAEFENYKKRMVKEQTRFLETANKDAISHLLPILDDFERSLAAAEKTKDYHKISEGVRMIYTHLKKALAKEGLEEINPVGEQFDPLWHEAVMQETSDEHEDDTVVEVLQKGYLFKGRVLRPAKVKVSKNSKQKEE